jgi:hypothetical protein
MDCPQLTDLQNLYVTAYTNSFDIICDFLGGDTAQTCDWFETPQACLYGETPEFMLKEELFRDVVALAEKIAAGKVPLHV